MRRTQCDTYEEAVIKLQKYVDKRWHTSKGIVFPEEKKRKWLKATPEDSYGDSNYKIELWVLEGSPVKQIVIVNHERKEICCYSWTLKKEMTFAW